MRDGRTRARGKCDLCRYSVRLRADGTPQRHRLFVGGESVYCHEAWFLAPRGCPYCGEPLRNGRLVCPECFDLPNLDPMLTRPKVNAKPIGVQPFVKG